MTASSFIELAPAWAREMYRNITTQLGQIMTEVKVQQEDLDALKANLTSIADDLETQLAALNVPEGTLAPVQAIVDRLRNDVAVPQPPADSAPAPADPSAPQDPAAP